MRTDLNNKIDSFLSGYRESQDGEYADVTDQDMSDLGDIINLLIELKCESDDDGDRPIEIRLVNRQKESFIYPCQIPNAKMYYSYKEFLNSRGRVGMLTSLIGTASKLLEVELQLHENSVFEEG